ncbi:DUF3830 family protein [Candidatus Bathyarchaeota archaeon]|nr:MAG: DUF3830 family protein [Candidatus Bathyarchaeota archaeon]
MKIRIITEATGPVEAEISWDKNPRTATSIWEALPIESKARRWGEEIYFPIPVELGEENSQDLVELGDLGYWPPGRSFCIFFGPTPVSTGEEIRPASPVNVFGKVTGDIKVFKKVKDGDAIRIERAE